ncbi:MAG: DUF4476 domain-containing protein [Myxococcota bacterium]
MLLVFAALIGCAPKTSNIRPQAMTLAASSNVYLRNSFDTDPSSYLGRFVPDDSNNLDESASMQLSCSQHISYRFVDGGGVRYSEMLNVSTAASARLGIPIIADADGSGQSDNQVKVEYILTGKMIAHIDDPQAFTDCCKATPDQCSRRYVGEFLQGTGAVYHMAARNADAQANVLDPNSGTTADAEFSRTSEWQRSVEFPNPIYFAFKVSETPYNQQSASSCANFMSSLPDASDGGAYVVGTSKPVKEETTARNRAMNNATIQAGRAVGATPEAPVQGMRPEDWCIETQQTDKGVRYKAKVLVYVPPQPEAPAQTPLTDPAAQPAVPYPDVPTGTPVYAPTPTPPPTLTQPTPTPAPTPTPTPTPAPEIIQPSPTPDASIGNGGAITAAGMQQLIMAINSESFSKDKLAVVQASAAGNTFTVMQVSQLLPLFSFEDDKVKVVYALRSRIVDPQNGALLASQFTFSSDKEEVMKLFQ